MLTLRTLVPAVVLLTSACREQPSPAAEPPAPPPLPAAPAPSATSAALRAAGWTRVARASHVCMVNDQDMGRDQIPVSVDGKTYYGCCANCKDKLERQDSARTARDPVTGTRVDKAGAVIARNDAGKVLYFESEQTFAQYTR